MANTWSEYGREWLTYQGFAVPPTWGEAELAAYGQKMAAIQQQAQSGGQQTQADYGQQGQPQGWGADLDFGDPDVIRRQALEFEQALEDMRREQQEAQQTFYELFRISHELDNIERQALHAHTGFTSDFDRQKVAQHMLEHKLNDPRKAWEMLQAPQREQQGYQRGRQEAESEARQRGRVPTTQTFSSSRDGRQRSQYHPQSDERRAEIMARMRQVAGIPREPERGETVRPSTGSPMPSTSSIPADSSGGGGPTPQPGQNS